MQPVPTAMTLPVPVPPQPDEAFSSWLVRLASAHGLRTRSLCSLLTKREVEFNTDLDGTAGNSLLELVCACTNRDPGKLKMEHTWAGFTGRLFRQVKMTSATPWLLPLRAFYPSRPAMQYCPECLREGVPYYRRSWRLSLLGICSKHGSQLQNVCAQCSAPVNFIRSQMLSGGEVLTVCWRCGVDARSAPPVAADWVDVEIGSHLLAAAHGGKLLPDLPPNISPTDQFEVLGLLCARLLRRQPRLIQWRTLAAQRAGTRLPEPNGRGGGTAFDLLADPVQRVPVLRTAVLLMKRWPEAFLEVARAADTRTSDFVAHFVACPKWFLEPLQTRLTPSRNKPVLSPGLLRVQKRREIILARRGLWGPATMPRFVSLLRNAGLYARDTPDSQILTVVRKVIEQLRKEGRGYQRRITQQVRRDSPEWSHLLLLAKPYRKQHCSNREILRRGIKQLCAGKYLSARDLSELLHRSHAVLVRNDLNPMVRAGDLTMKYDRTVAGSEGRPGQAYTCASAT